MWPQGASVQGSGLFCVCDERVVLGGCRFLWLVAKHLWVIQSEERMSDPDLARCEDD